MKKSDKTIQEQEAIIAEYLLGDATYRKLGAKHGVDFRAIHHWVTKFQGKPVNWRFRGGCPLYFAYQ